MDFTHHILIKEGQRHPHANNENSEAYKGIDNQGTARLCPTSGLLSKDSIFYPLPVHLLIFLTCNNYYTFKKGKMFL